MLPKFDYARPENLEQALDLLRQAGQGAVPIAGGTDLLVKLRSGLLVPSLVVDISRLREIRFLRRDRDGIRLGAGVTHSLIATDPLVHHFARALADAARSVGTPQIRNRGTIGGNLANASPAADTSVSVVALDGVLEIRSQEGARKVKAQEFFWGPGMSVLRPGELIVSVFFPDRGWTGMSFLKLGKRNAHAISVVNVAAAAVVRGGIIEDIRVAVGAAAPTPVRAVSVESALRGGAVSRQLVVEASSRVAGDLQPISDIRASAEYRFEVAKALVARAVCGALGLGVD